MSETEGGVAGTEPELPEECSEVGECECEEIEFVEDVLLFTFFMLFLGLVTKHLLRGIPIPYTGLLLILGLFFGFIHSSARPDREALLCETRLEACCEEHAVWRRGYRYLGRGIEGWISIEPGLLLMIHLPALIYASAFTLDFHITKRNIYQILILAGPGVAIGIFFVAMTAKFIFPYEWCWPKALMFGAMLSATDPVAVVALLKEVGASAILGTVIEGESLFNDGTAFVFFLLFRDLIRWTTSCNDGQCNDAFKLDARLCGCLDDAAEGTEALGEMTGVALRRTREEAEACVNHSPDFQAIQDFPHRTPGQSLGFFLQLAIGGPLVGMMFGTAAATWINYVFNDMVVEVAITLVTAYLTYYTAEVLLEVSGVLSVVGLGITMAVLARPRLSPKTHEPMEVFWEMVEYFANTMIFVYAGVRIALALRQEEGNYIHSEEWGFGILLFLFLQVIRLATVVICYPFMIMSGYYIDYKNALVMVWGGLRGAVGLALGLIVELDVRRIDPRFRALTIFYMGLIAAFTIIINGSTMGHILHALGITKPKPEKLEVLLHVVKELEQVGDETVSKPDTLLGDPDTALVKELVKLNVESIIPSNREVVEVMHDAEVMHHPSAIAMEEHLAHQHLTPAELQTISDPPHNVLAKVARFVDELRGGRQNKRELSFPRKTTKMGEITASMLVLDFRSRLLTGVKSVYGHQNEAGLLDPDQHYNLTSSANIALDNVDDPLGDWGHLERSLSVQFWRKMVNVGEQLLSRDWKITRLGKPVQNFLDNCFFNALEHSAIMAKTFIAAHEEACNNLQEYIEFVKKDQQKKRAGRSTASFIEEASAAVLVESRENQQKAVEFLQNMRRAYPEVTLAIKTKRTAWEVLQEKMKYVDELALSGMVERKEAEGLKAAVEKRLKHLVYHPPKMALPEAMTLLMGHPLFQEMDPDAFAREVMPNVNLKLFSLGERIYSIGEMSEDLSIVVRGAVRIESSGGERAQVQQGTGAMMGISEVVLKQRRSRSLVAETAVVEVYQINADTFRAVVEKYEPVRRRAWQMAGAFQTLKAPWGPHKGKSHEELMDTFRKATMIERGSGTAVVAGPASFLVYGEVAPPGTGEVKLTINAPSPLVEGGKYVAVTSVKVLQMAQPERRPPLRRLESKSIMIGALGRRWALAKLSTRPKPLSHLSMGGRVARPTGVGMKPELTDVAEGPSDMNATAAALAAVAAVDAEEEYGEDTPLQMVDSDPSWRVDHAVQSADNQLRREASRGRPLVTRASTGVTPGKM